MPSKIRGGTKDKHLADMHIPRVSALGAGGGAAAPTTLILDQFTDANGTALASHTIAPTNTPATSWTVRGGGWNIQSNEANVASAGVLGEGGIATVAAGIANVTLSVTARPTASNAIGVCARYTDNSNFWIVDVLAGTGARIIERNAGVNTTRASAAMTVTAGTQYAVVATFNGQSISATVDGANNMSYGSAALNQAVTVHGIRDSASVGNRADNFKVETV